MKKAIITALGIIIVIGGIIIASSVLNKQKSSVSQPAVPTPQQKITAATPTPVIEQTDEQAADQFATEDDDTDVDLSDIGN
ncbi:hypothetical protein C4559_02425 [Candidatus Microgenomates bacterium]|nr:MAG: hypothetical protein C4559_02425 [Candidatus Microgenomates bacterium]